MSRGSRPNEVALPPVAAREKNFGAAAEDYATYRVGFPDSLFERLRMFEIGLEGQAVVDVGTGTGTLGRGFARHGCDVVGVDPDERLLRWARSMDAEAGVTIEYRVGVAEDLPVPDASADVVSAGQSWHWFDGPAAAREIARVLRPGGRVVVAHLDWLPLPGNVVEATEHLIVEHNPKAARFMGGDGVHVESLPHLRAAGFSGFEMFSYDLDVLYGHEAWRGRIRASVGVGASLSPEEVDAFDTEHAELLGRMFHADQLAVPHRIFVVVGRQPVRR